MQRWSSWSNMPCLISSRSKESSRSGDYRQKKGCGGNNKTPGSTEWRIKRLMANKKMEKDWLRRADDQATDTVQEVPGVDFMLKTTKRITQTITWFLYIFSDVLCNGQQCNSYKILRVHLLYGSKYLRNSRFYFDGVSCCTTLLLVRSNCSRKVVGNLLRDMTNRTSGRSSSSELCKSLISLLTLISSHIADSKILANNWIRFQRGCQTFCNSVLSQSPSGKKRRILPADSKNALPSSC